MQIEQLKSIIEAALLASNQPMNLHQLHDLFIDSDEVSREDIARSLEALGNDCEGRGVELKEVASGFRYQVRQDVHPWISRMWTERPSRYSRALLETLALIAYRQPITRPEIEQIRGVVVSSNIIKTMEEREWIRVVGYRDVPGKPALFGTTRAFLDYFNLKSLDQLPPLSEIREMEDPQMRFEQEPLPGYVDRNLPIDPEAEAAAAEAAAEPEVTEIVAGDTDEAGSDAAEREAITLSVDVNAPDVDGMTDSASVLASAAEPFEAAINDVSSEPSDARLADSEAASIDAHAAATDVATPFIGSVEPDAIPAPATGSTHNTADEAAAPADANSGAREQDTEEYRA